tara:strand:+ start:447 stop:1511 length:1065 start_codon:yes stop_codon:yes gene_type:complete
MIFFSLLFFLGTRYGWGMDFNEYFKDFYNINDDIDNIREIITITTQSILSGDIYLLAGREPLYVMLMLISEKFSSTVLGFNLLSQCIILTNFFIFCNKSKNFWFVLAICLPFIIFVGTDFTRQFLAISFIMASLAFFEQKKFFYALIFILIAPLFHLPATMLLPLGFFYILNLKMILRILLFMFIINLLYYLYNNGVFGLKQNSFFGSEQRLGNYEKELGAFSRYLYFSLTGLSLFTYAYLNAFYQTTIVKSDGERKLLLFVIIFYSFTAYFISFEPVSGYRISIYLIPFLIYYTSKIPDLSKANYKNFCYIICTLSILLNFLWINFSASYYVYLPYKNILFHDIKYPKRPFEY